MINGYCLVIVFLSKGYYKLQLPIFGFLSTFLRKCRSKFRLRCSDQTEIRSFPTRRYHHSWRHYRKQDVFHSGRNRRYNQVEQWSYDHSERWLLFWRYKKFYESNFFPIISLIIYSNYVFIDCRFEQLIEYNNSSKIA